MNLMVSFSVERSIFDSELVDYQHRFKMENMKSIFTLIIALTVISTVSFAKKGGAAVANTYLGNDPLLQYVGRIDYSDPAKPRLHAPGVYITAYFEGNTCEVVINDEVKWGNKHNYVSFIIDEQAPIRMKLKEQQNIINLSDKLTKGKHKLVICKSTEANIGYIGLESIKVDKLLKPKALPIRRIECYGNSITCGTGSDMSVVPCDSGEWHDQHNAYMSYGAVTARNLNAQWMLSSFSGIGLIHSCCNITFAMPQIFDKVNFNDNAINWNFSNYQPDVVTIALGQNDGVQDSVAFCSAYVDFIGKLRVYYPKATFICLTSPMADETLVAVMKRYLTGIVDHLNSAGDKNVYKYYFSKRFHAGCGDHPSLAEHEQIAAELTDYIKKVKKW